MTLGDITSIIHHDDKIELFALTEEQIDILRLGGYSMWKDFFLLCIPLCVSCGLNIIPNFHKVGDWWLNANIIVSISAGIIACFCFKAWKMEECKFAALLAKIKAQPAQTRIQTGESLEWKL